MVRICCGKCGVVAAQPFSASKAPRSPSMQADLSPMLQSGRGHVVQKDQAWGDNLMRNLSLDAQYPHVGLPPSGSGIDPTHLAQQLEQLEIQHLQRMGSTGSALQRQLSGVPPSPQSARVNLEQLVRPGGLPARDHQGLNLPHPQIPPQPHQPPVPIPPSGPVLEQLLRLQQQQQQQQQLPTQVWTEWWSWVAGWSRIWLCCVCFAVWVECMYYGNVEGMSGILLLR
jgi:hypothetical protein